MWLKVCWDRDMERRGGREVERVLKDVERRREAEVEVEVGGIGGRGREGTVGKR